MDIFFSDPSEVPLPPGEVKIRELRATPFPEGSRVRVYLEVDPFQRRPNAELALFSPQGQELASTSIIESMDRKMEVVMHLRAAPETGEYRLKAVLFYTDPLPEGATGMPEPQIVDRAEIRFGLERAEDHE